MAHPVLTKDWRITINGDVVPVDGDGILQMENASLGEVTLRVKERFVAIPLVRDELENLPYSGLFQNPEYRNTHGYENVLVSFDVTLPDGSMNGVEPRLPWAGGQTVLEINEDGTEVLSIWKSGFNYGASCIHNGWSDGYWFDMNDAGPGMVLVSDYNGRADVVKGKLRLQLARPTFNPYRHDPVPYDATKTIAEMAEVWYDTEVIKR